MLVEDDPRWNGSKSEIMKAIHDNLNKSDWFIAILAEEFRPIVAKEIKFAFSKYFQIDDLIIYVKTDKQTAKSWNRIKKWMQDKQIKFPIFN